VFQNENPVLIITTIKKELPMSPYQVAQFLIDIELPRHVGGFILILLTCSTFRSLVPGKDKSFGSVFQFSALSLGLALGFRVILYFTLPLLADTAPALSAAAGMIGFLFAGLFAPMIYRKIYPDVPLTTL
jgi:hypothetical protein